MPGRKKKSRTKEPEEKPGAAELVELELPLDVGNANNKITTDPLVRGEMEA
jgi:hypothetical protein